ncbi:MFS transporter [Yoonia litorea]|uniref:Na+/melibiose symporter n=1 Tax=Yoonia litorea TaxID=1123755 RepID=A0A1I6MCC4_9RHOB|nr:MFS transporter [Yoonia litorea]SFS13311.1 Na+/melibiose symporter [Yoonia litorea]
MKSLRSYNRHFLTGTGIIAAVYLAQNMLSFALPLLALEISGTGAGFALITGAGFVPNILFAIFVGVINDRIRKATGFRAYSILLALSCAALWLLMVTDLVNLAALAVFMIALNLLGYAIGNLQFTLLRLTVPHTDLSDATSLSSAINSTISTVGPALGGLALYLIGGTGLVGLVTLLLAVSMAAAYTVTPEEPDPTPAPFWPSLREGFVVFSRNRELVMMTIAVVLTNAAAGAFTVAMILKLKTGLGANDFQVGLVAAVGGVGSIIASGYAPRLRRWLGYRAAFYWPIWVLALICLAGAGAPTLWLLFIISFFEGAFSIFYAIGVWSYRQESTEAAHMGRVAGITGAIFKLLMPPVIFLAGVLTDAEAVAAAFWLAASLNIAAAIFLTTVAGWGWPRRPVAA